MPRRIDSVFTGPNRFRRAVGVALTVLGVLLGLIVALVALWPRSSGGVPSDSSARYTDAAGYHCKAGATDDLGHCPGNPRWFNHGLSPSPTTPGTTSTTSQPHRSRAPVSHERWVKTDLGTLGGWSSYATDVNERGEVVGVSWTAGHERHVFLWRRGKMTDLGFFDRHARSGPAIDATGDVAWNVEGDTGVLWSRGVKRRLGFDVHAINDRGQIVGVKDGLRAVLWQAGRVRDLGKLDLPALALSELDPMALPAVTINDDGDVAGTTTVNGRPQAFVWHDGRRRVLGTLAGFDESQALSINSAGDVLAVCAVHDPSSTSGPLSQRTSRPCLWHAGSWRGVGRTRALSLVLGDRGQVAWTWQLTFRDQRASLWRNGRKRSIASFGSGSVTAINGAGRLAGWSGSYGRNTHAFTWVDGVTTRLSQRGRRSAAYGMNDAGQIVGDHEFGTSPRHGDRPPRHAVMWTRSR